MLLKSFLLGFVIVCASGSPAERPHERANAREESEWRLVEGAVTTQFYDITLRLPGDMFDNAESNEFDGEVTIVFINNVETNEIRLHANGLTFSEVGLRGVNPEDIPLTNTEFVSDPSTDILTITTEEPLAANTTYQFRFVYKAQLRTDQMYGFYRSSYPDDNGNPRYLGSTQFQPTHARKVFPCFDEPSYKAQFNIRIRHPNTVEAYGNTRRSTSADSNDPNFNVTTFAQTPVMPTYLIAFVVSDFTCSQSQDLIDTGIPHNVCSREASASTRNLALTYSPNITWVMEAFTGIKYREHGISKIDQFAIPDFAAGAMENWGLITYRETALLWDEEHSSNRYKQRVLTVIAHELAHFWFGNLVTCNWWSNTFLNEGFATYFEYFAPQEVDPSLELDKQFVIEQLQAVLVSDASPSSAALSSPASTATEVSGRFSSISYNKGGSIFRMVSHIVGLENFKLGINQYLNAKRFSNAQPEELWSNLGSFAPAANLPSGQSLTNVMSNWVNKGGYPLVTVSNNGRNLVLSQKRYLTSGTPSTEDVWYVPISYTTASDDHKFESTSANAWLLQNANSQTLNNVLQDENDWIILNNQQTGYYRIDYSDVLWARIREALNRPGFDGIHELNRAQIVDDYYSFARYGYKTFTQMLDLFTFLRKETSYYPMYSAFNAFSNMIARTGNTEIRRLLSEYILSVTEVIYNSVPFNVNKDHDQIYTHTKVLVVPWACRLGLADCVNNAVAAFSRYRQSGIKPNKNMRSVVYCNGLRNSTDIANDWDFLWQEFLSNQLATEQVTILSALGCATDEAVLKGFLEKSIDANSGIRMQDALSVFSAVYGGNPEGVDVALDFLIENYDRINAYYTSMNSIPSLFNGIAGRLTREDQTNKLQAFISSTDLGDNKGTAEAALGAALNNLAWIEKFEEELNLYFNPPTEAPPTDAPGGGGGGGAADLQISFACLAVFALVQVVLAYF